MTEYFQDVETFLATWRNTALFVFSATAFIYSIIRISKSLYDWISDREKAKQRHEFQAGYFDVQEQRFNDMLAKYDTLRNAYWKLKIEIEAIKKAQ